MLFRSHDLLLFTIIRGDTQHIARVIPEDLGDCIALGSRASFRFGYEVLTALLILFISGINHSSECTILINDDDEGNSFPFHARGSYLPQLGHRLIVVVECFEYHLSISLLDLWGTSITPCSIWAWKKRGGGHWRFFSKSMSKSMIPRSRDSSMGKSCS